MVDHSVQLDKVLQYFQYAARTWTMLMRSITTARCWSFPSRVSDSKASTTSPSGAARPPADVGYKIRRITARDDFVVTELTISYDGGPPQFGVQLLEFRDDKVARERIYVMEG